MKIVPVLVLMATTLFAQVDEYAIKNQNFFTSSPVTTRATAQYTGTNVGGTEWTRPFADGTCCSGLGPVRYHAQAFQVDATGAYDVGCVQDGWDGYLFVYADSFDPNNQTANFVAGDDDGNGGIGTSDIEGVTLNAGTVYWCVTTGFANGDEGDFTNTISGPGNITFGELTVPTLSQWGMIAFLILMAGTAMVVLRRSTVQA